MKCPHCDGTGQWPDMQPLEAIAEKCNHEWLWNVTQGRWVCPHCGATRTRSEVVMMKYR